MAKTPAPTSSTTKPATKTPAKKPAAKAASAGSGEAKVKFAKAIEEAKAGATALTADAKAKAEGYRDQLSAKSTDWVEEAKDIAGQAKGRAADLAIEGKTKASDAIASLGKLVGDNAHSIDEKLGTRYGDYARTAARTMQESAAKLDSKDINELGDDAKEFVRKSPGLAIGIAATLGFLISRLFKGSAKN
jgi:ElaB/YqjD/DUF883 family membrane-anchored ribosome-binding protein